MMNPLNRSQKRSAARISLSVLLSFWLIVFHVKLKQIFFVEYPLHKSIAILSIALISAYLIYTKRDKLKRAYYSISILALMAIFILLLGYAFCSIYHLTPADTVALFLLIPALILLCYGTEVIQIILFPLLYFLGIIPLLFTTQYDLYIYWIAIAVLYGYLHYPTIFRRSLFVFFTIISTWITQDILLTWAIENHYHAYAPLGLMVLNGLILWVLAQVLQEPKNMFITAKSPLEFERIVEPPSDKLRHWVYMTILVSITISFLPWVMNEWQNYDQNIKFIRGFSVAHEREPENWRGPKRVTGNAWEPHFLGSMHAYQALYYAKETLNPLTQPKLSSTPVYFYQASSLLKYSSKYLSDPNNAVYNPKVWRLLASHPVNITLANQKTLKATENIIEAEGCQRVVWSWYYMGGIMTQSPPVSSLLNVLEFSLGVHEGIEASGVIVVSTPITVSIETSRGYLESFLKDHYTKSMAF